MTAYWIERFALRRFVPAAALIALAAQTGSSLDAIRWGIGTLLALLLLAQFRLWDDLADRDRDREAHPTRVLVRTKRVWPFHLTCASLALVNLTLVLVSAGAPGATVLVALNATAVAWYAWRPHARTAAGDLVLLAKYPVFVVLLASSSASFLPHPNVWIAAAATYIAACAFDIWHDAASPLRSTR